MEMTGGLVRRGLVKALTIAVMMACAFSNQTPAQTSNDPQVEPKQIFEAGYRLASFGVRAAAIVSRKDVQPSVAEFAQQMRASRQVQLEQLRAIGERRGWPAPADLPEQQSILKNLEPLDSVEFSRRYAEATIQALEQELRVYRVAATQTDPDLRQLGQEWLGKIGLEQSAARDVLAAAKR